MSAASLLLSPHSDSLNLMAGSSSFDYLVAELSSEERRLLLERIKTSMPVSSEPLFPAHAAPGAGSASTIKAEELGILPRLLLFLRGLFSGKSRDELLREDELKEIGRKVEQRKVGVIDRRRCLILGPVVENLRALRDSSRFFYNALDRSVERDKGAFCAFLASIELPETHERLLSETDPASIAESMAATGGPPDDLTVRQAALAAYDSIFSDLSERGRRAMYQDLRSVLFLKRLSGFLFDRLLGTFKEGAAPDSGPAASFFDARELLLDLGDILFSMSEPPSTSLMEAIFVFADREELNRKGSDADAVLGADMAKAETALSKIRSFNEAVPLGDLLRLASGDPEYLPRELPGGEDWLAIYKAFWRERIEVLLEEWRSAHRNRELVEEIASFVGEPGPAGFVHISREEREDAPPIRLDIALSFLDAFYRGPFVRELNRPLKIVLVDGEFYRKDNRIEYTDAYDAILRIPELLATLDARLGPEGEFGAAWSSARLEMGPSSIKLRRLQSVARSAEEEAERIIQRVGSALRTMTLILQGFLKGEAGGRYDSLANLSYIDGKANKEFLRSLDKAKDRCEKAHSLLAELSGLDLSLDE
jgi:hypothetical protein